MYRAKERRKASENIPHPWPGGDRAFWNNKKRDPLEVQHPKFESSGLDLIKSVTDAISLTPPSPGLSATLLPNISEPYSPKGPDNVKITALYRCTGRLLRPPHGITTAAVISKNLKRDPLGVQHPKFENNRKISNVMRNPTMWHVRPSKTRISLDIRPVWSDSSLCAQWVARAKASFMRTAKTLSRLGGCPGWSESSMGAQVIL